MSSNRIEQIDYLKSICIILMVAFHLVYFTTKHPYLHQMVYTFHMPIFLMISGYLTHIDRPLKSSLKKILWLFIPYVIMESGYVIMASILPINEHIDHLTPLVYLNKIFLHPIGPYWYLHTLIICYIVGQIGGLLRKKISLSSYIILLGVVFYGLAQGIHIINFPNTMYFMIGLLISLMGKDFTKLFPATFVAAIPLILLFIPPGLSLPFEILNKSTIRGIMVVYFMISFLLATYKLILKNNKINRFLLKIGRNTLPILLFSPIFTILCKVLVKPLMFEPTGILFMMISVAITISASLAIAWTMDKLHLSRWFSGKNLLCA